MPASRSAAVETHTTNRRRTGCGRYVPARNAAPSSARNASTPRCSISASVSLSTPAEPRFRFIRRHASRRTSSLQIRSIRAWKRRSGDRLAAAHRRRCNWRTLSRGEHLSGELGPVLPAMPSRVLAPTPCPPQGSFPPAALCCTALRGTITPSDSRCAAPAFTFGLCESRCPDSGCADGPLVCSPPCPRAAPRTPPSPPARTPPDQAQETWPSPRHEQLGSRVVTVSRLQASLHVAARGLAPSVEAFDTPLGPQPSPAVPGVCYSALRRLPRRDLHPLEKNSVTQTVSPLHRHDAPCRSVYETRPRRGQAGSTTLTTG